VLEVGTLNLQSLSLPSITITAKKIVLNTTTEAPIEVSSQTLVTNLNADRVDGHDTSVS